METSRYRKYRKYRHELFILPIRNGNIHLIAISQLGRPLFILPIRNGNQV